MATILRSCKYINFFSSYHLQTIKSTSTLRLVLRSNSSHVEINRKGAVLKNVFFESRYILNKEILDRIRHRYFIKYYASYDDLSTLMEIFYSNSSILDNRKFLDTLKGNDILMLIRCCGNMMKHEMPDAKLKLLDSIYQILKSKDYQFDVNHYNALIEVYLENEKDFSPVDFLSEMINNNVQPNNVTYEHLLAYYCRKGNISDANKILHYFKENEIPINEKIFSLLIIGNAEANDMNGALNILNTMKIMGCIPSVKAYAALLYSYAKKGDIENIMETLRTCEQKDILIDDNRKLDILYYLSINGHSQHVDKIMPLISWDSQETDVNCFIPKLLYHKQIDLAYRIISAVCNKPIKMNSQLQFALLFMKNLIKCDLPVEEVIKYLDLIEQMKLPAYENAIINCFIRNQEHYCIPLFKAWQKMDGKIQEHFFWPLLAEQGSQKRGNYVEILKTMRNDFNIDPGCDTILNFIIPHIHRNTVENMFKILIDDCKLSPQHAVNAVLQACFSQNKLQKAELCIKLAKRYNVQYDSQELAHIYKKLKPIESNEVLSFLEKTLNLPKWSKEKNILERITEIPQLNSIDIGFKLRKYCQIDQISKAEDLLRNLENSQNPVLSLDKLLSYFQLLVKKDRIEDAFQTLTKFISNKSTFTVHEKALEEQCLKSLNLLAEKGSVDGINKLLDILKGLQVRISEDLLQPSINVHLLRNDFEAAIETVQKIEKQYGWLSHEDKIMEILIKNEDVNSLQNFTNLCNKHSGYIKTLLNLSIAFLRNNRLIQSKQVLMSTDLSIRGNTLRRSIQKLLSNGGISMIKDFIELTKGMNNVNRINLYELLLEKYSTMNDWKEGLNLAQQLMDEKKTPSLLFSSMLSELLKRNNQEIPFSWGKFLIKFQEMKETTDSAQIVRFFIESNSSPDHDYMDILLQNLIKAEDIESIDLIYKYFFVTNQESLDRKNILESCENDSQVIKYLDYVNSSIDKDNEKHVRQISHSFNSKTLKYFIHHPDHFKTFASVATKMYSKNRQLCKPLLTVISFYCLQDPKNSPKIWNKYAPELTKSFFPYKFCIESIYDANCVDILPQIVESFQESHVLHKQLLYESFLRVFDERGRYARGLRELLTCELSRENENASNEERDYLERNRSRAIV